MRFFLPTASFQQLSMEAEAETQKLCPDAGAFFRTDPSPPAILTTGTRDLLLNNTVLIHRKFRAAGIVAELEVYEGQSHAQYSRDDRLPETRDAFGEITAFFDKRLDH